MNEKYQEYLNGIEKVGTRKVAKLFSQIGDFDYEHCDNVEELQDLIISMQPNCLKAIDNITISIKAWVKYSCSEEIYQKIYNLLSFQQLDRESIWQRIKDNVPRKFISHKQYVDILHNIDAYEENNPEYLQTLFMSIYEGLYCRDYSITWNLRGSNVEGEYVTIINNDGNPRSIKVTKQLAKNLLFVADIDTQVRQNRFGVFNLRISGLYPDSCFKLERRELRGKGLNYQNSYGNMLRKIVNEYVEYPLTAQQLYISGIMYRLGLVFKENNITLDEAFSYNNKERIINKIITAEFERINATLNIKNFRESVRGFIDVFNEDWE